MKKTMIFITVAIISLLMISCTSKPVDIKEITPFEMMNITENEINSLYSLWPPKDSDINEFGQILSFNIKAKIDTEYTNLDYLFKSGKNIDELKELFSTIVKGEWIDSDFTENTSIYDGFVNDTNYTNCLIEDYQDHNRIVLEIDINQSYSELDNIFDNHYPYHLLILHEALCDDNLYSKSFEYNIDENKISYNIGWRIKGKEQEVHDYFKTLLSEQEEYEYLKEYMYAGPFIAL
jgi:hypothetical protein